MNGIAKMKIRNNLQSKREEDLWIFAFFLLKH